MAPTKKKSQAAAAPDGKKVRLSGCNGEVIKARRFGIHISFSHEGKSQVAGFAPGKAFVNGHQLVLDVCKSDQELALLFPKGMKVEFDCVEARSEAQPRQG